MSRTTCSAIATMGDFASPPHPRTAGPSTAANRCSSPITPQPKAADEPLLCQHCGRTASNGISCQGFCVADSDY
ncbi:hypothetical protein KBY96_08420 [Cyanobium sp. ATX 6A2]|nr:hypothetical protein [Cyanobium sp. ATX 6A2]MCP9887950.1 hypothetical protein [Cyanobium sp. ATX 6A2]